jgi:hypothetical protein
MSLSPIVFDALAPAAFPTIKSKVGMQAQGRGQSRVLALGSPKFSKPLLGEIWVQSGCRDFGRESLATFSPCASFLVCKQTSLVARGDPGPPPPSPLVSVCHVACRACPAPALAARLSRHTVRHLAGSQGRPVERQKHLESKDGSRAQIKKTTGPCCQQRRVMPS